MPIEETQIEETQTTELVNYEELSYIEIQEINQNLQVISFISISIYFILIFIISVKFFKFLLGM